MTYRRGMTHWILIAALVAGCGKGTTDATPAPTAGSGSTAPAKAPAKAIDTDADAAPSSVDKLAKDLAELDKRTSDAIENVMRAKNDADRTSAKAKLVALQRDKAELEARVAAARAEAAKAARAKGVTIEERCLDNPLAKGC
jgi:hypothetical protein